MIRLHRADDHGWYIHEFRREHNHGLAMNSGRQKMQWSSHRNIDPHTKDLDRNLRDNNVGLTKTFSVIGSFFGSMENILFNKCSLRMLCASMSRDHSEDDSTKTYEVLSEMKMKGPNFRDSCLVDSEWRIRALMWTNGWCKDTNFVGEIDEIVWFVLNSCDEIEQYREMFRQDLEQGGMTDIQKMMATGFASWFRCYVTFHSHVIRTLGREVLSADGDIFLCLCFGN